MNLIELRNKCKSWEGVFDECKNLQIECNKLFVKSSENVSANEGESSELLIKCKSLLSKAQNVVNEYIEIIKTISIEPTIEGILIVKFCSGLSDNISSMLSSCALMVVSMNGIKSVSSSNDESFMNHKKFIGSFSQN